MEENKIVDEVSAVEENKKGFFTKIKETKADLKVKNYELITKHPAIGWVENGAKIVTGGAMLVGAYMLGKKSVKVIDNDIIEDVVEDVVEVTEF